MQVSSTKTRPDATGPKIRCVSFTIDATMGSAGDEITEAVCVSDWTLNRIPSMTEYFDESNPSKQTHNNVGRPFPSRFKLRPEA